MSSSGDSVTFSSVADDKKLIWWRASSEAVERLGVENYRKKLVCCCAASDGVVVVGDKFGDGHVSRLAALQETRAEFDAEFGLLSSLTAMLRLPNGTIAVAERENKLVVLSNPLFCEYRAILLGHEAFVSALGVLVRGVNDFLLVSASGDGTLRLWNTESGKQVGEPLRVVAADDDDDSSVPMWRSLACSGAEHVVAVAQDGRAFAARIDAANNNAFSSRQIEGISSAIEVCAAPNNAGFWLSDRQGVHLLPLDCNAQNKTTPLKDVAVHATQEQVTTYLASLDVCHYVHLSFRKEQKKKRKQNEEEEEEEEEAEEKEEAKK